MFRRQFGAVRGTLNTRRQALACAFLIDTLPIRIAFNSFASITGAHSNRHSSALSKRRQIREDRVPLDASNALRAGARPSRRKPFCGIRSGGAGESRTPDTQFRKLLLYPSELQPHTGRLLHFYCTRSGLGTAALRSNCSRRQDGGRTVATFAQRSPISVNQTPCRCVKIKANLNSDARPAPES